MHVLGRSVAAVAMALSLAGAQACGEDEGPGVEGSEGEGEGEGGAEGEGEGGAEGEGEGGAEGEGEGGAEGEGEGPAGCEPDCLMASQKARVLAPDAPDADLEALVAGNTAFALALHGQLRTIEAGNLFYSPFSISQALAMTWAGARGDTESAMADALRFALPQARLHPAFNRLDLELARRGEDVDDAEGDGFRLNIANSIWGQAEFDFVAEFLDVLAESYGAGLRVVDFAGDPETARQTINEWVEARTEGRIEDLLPEGVITALTRLVLTNAIYFKASWAVPFEEQATADGAFHLLDGEVAVPLMHGSVEGGYARGDGWAAADVPYYGDELSMLVIVPDGGTFADFEARFDGAVLDAVVAGLEHHQIALTFPRFGFEAAFGLNDTLAALGMEVAFRCGPADFTGMYAPGGLCITDVVHKAFVDVDEAGTEAAAATAVVVGFESEPPAAELVVDRPFIFLIRDRTTGTILFVGSVVDPS